MSFNKQFVTSTLIKLFFFSHFLTAACLIGERGVTSALACNNNMTESNISETYTKKDEPLRQFSLADENKNQVEINMDFDDVDITVLIKFISELTGKNFIIDNNVRGKVTLISPTKITVDEAYRLFESVLEIHGFTTVESGSVIKIIPAIEARSKDIETRLR